MKFKNLKKFIAPTVIASLIVSIPVLSTAISSYRSSYNEQPYYLNRGVTRPSNYYISDKKSNYSLSRGNYYRLKSNNNSNLNTSSKEGHSLSREEAQMLSYVNEARKNAGLEALEINMELAYLARIKSEDMHNNNYFSHDSPTYGSPFNMMDKFEIKYKGAAENIARNNNVEAAHNSLMRSQGHKNNILNPAYTHIGIGIYNGYYTQIFINK